MLKHARCVFLAHRKGPRSCACLSYGNLVPWYTHYSVQEPGYLVMGKLNFSPSHPVLPCWYILRMFPRVLITRKSVHLYTRTCMNRICSWKRKILWCKLFHIFIRHVISYCHPPILSKKGQGYMMFWGRTIWSSTKSWNGWLIGWKSPYTSISIVKWMDLIN